MDFGAAKELDNQAPQNTIIFKQGYAPPEQYTGGGKQGPWTDVYALAATMYTALAGEQPIDAVLRMQQDEMETEYSKLSGVTDWQRNALKKGLELKPAERYQNMETFLADLSVMPRIEEQKTLIRTEEEKGHRHRLFADRTQSRKNGSEPDQIKNRKRYSFIGWILGVILLAMLSGMAIHIWDGQTAAKEDTKGNNKGQLITEQQNDPGKDNPEDTDMDKSETEAQQTSTTESSTKQESDVDTSEGTGATAEIYNRQTTENTKASTEASSKETKTATTEGTTANAGTTSRPTTEKPTTEAVTTENKKKKSSSKDDDIIVEPKDKDVIID